MNTTALDSRGTSPVSGWSRCATSEAIHVSRAPFGILILRNSQRCSQGTYGKFLRYLNEGRSEGEVNDLRANMSSRGTMKSSLPFIEKQLKHKPVSHGCEVNSGCTSVLIQPAHSYSCLYRVQASALCHSLAQLALLLNGKYTATYCDTLEQHPIRIIASIKQGLATSRSSDPFI